MKLPCTGADNLKAFGINGNVVIDFPVMVVFRNKRLIE
jgi:hypothetical protein